MKCDICKEREASIHIKEIRNNENISLNLCSVCAAKQNKDKGFNLAAFNLAEILYNLGKLNLDSNDNSADYSKEQPSNVITCSQCGWTVSDIHSHSGQLGCAQCYNTFRHLISEAIDNVHRGTIHIGKHPKVTHSNDRAMLMRELSKLQREIQLLIKKEDFEQAALVRDQIRSIEERLQNESQAGA